MFNARSSSDAGHIQNGLDDEATRLLNSSNTEINNNRIYLNGSTIESSTNHYQSLKNHMSQSMSQRQCPTCKGTGKVDKDQQDKLVALIPLSDNRLKPKRRWLWILTTFIFCALAATVITYLLAPRSVRVNNTLTNLEPYNMSYMTEPNSTIIIGISLFLEEIYLVKNDNYFDITMRNLTLEMNRNSHIIYPTLYYEKNVNIPSRSSKELSVKLEYVIYTLNDPYASLCIRGIITELFSLVSTTFSFSSLWNSNEEAYLNNMQYILCKNSTIV